MNLNKRQFVIIIDIIVLFFIAFILFSIRKNISNVITPFIMSLVVAYLLNPLVDFMEKKGIRRNLAILIAFVGIIIILVLLFMSFIPRLANDISVLVNDIPNIFIEFDKLIEDIKNNPNYIIDVSRFFDIDKELLKLSESFREVLTNLSSRLLQSTAKLLDIVMIPIITYYYLKDKNKFIRHLYHLIPVKFREETRKISADIDTVLGGFIRGQLIIALFVGLLTGIGCYVIGIPYSWTVGLVAGVTNIIPYFGPFLGGIMPVILGLMNKPILALWVVIWIIVVQQIESTFLSPKIMSHSVGLHPLTVIFSILLFGNIFGVIGMIIGVPLIGSIKVIMNYGKEFIASVKESY